MSDIEPPVTVSLGEQAGNGAVGLAPLTPGPVLPLGHLERIDVRDAWKSEEYDFTPWLARPENLALLSEALGIDLEFVDREVRVGRFEADIVATDLDATVVIENQLERTDHDHLGKLLVYASGLEAKTVIWIAREVTDEYRNALDWLNENTREGLNFFGIEIELWRIGDSAPAPKFNLVCQPNEWKKTLSGAGGAGEGALTETKQLQREFWAQFVEHLADGGSHLNRRKPLPQHWYSIAVGRSGFELSLTLVSSKGQVGCELYINPERSKLAFSLLKEQQAQIEAELGALDWRELPGKHACRIIQYAPGGLEPQSDWSTLHAYLRERAEKFHSAFSPRVQALDLEQPDDDEGPLPAAE